jgi:DNA-binding beta-propeller fold protein YncE
VLPFLFAAALTLTDIKLQGVKVDMISSVAAAPDGTIYLLQRGKEADPVIVVDRHGKVLRSWGKGMYEIPHSIRLDPQGNVWTVDAASSMVYEFSRDGKKLLEIAVGGQPANAKSAFKGTTDIAFGAKGQLYISDGYANARILEYTREGKPVRAWGTPGKGPGEFNLPHGIAIDNATGTLFVADRENGRVQKFDLEGKYLGEINGLGKTFSLDFVQGALWAGSQPRDQPNGAPGWITKVDPKSGTVLERVDSPGHHSVSVTRAGEVFTGTRPDRLLWFRRP